jgi:hypothetical protein
MAAENSRARQGRMSAPDAAYSAIAGIGAAALALVGACRHR